MYQKVNEIVETAPCATPSVRIPFPKIIQLKLPKLKKKSTTVFSKYLIFDCTTRRRCATMETILQAELWCVCTCVCVCVGVGVGVCVCVYVCV